MSKYISDIAFSDSVKKIQKKEGSRSGYQFMAEKRDWANSISESLRYFIAHRDSFYIATVNHAGQPYIQHRGGPVGFLKVLDNYTLGFADFSGNRQFISVGNIHDNKNICLFLMDYPNRKRIKIWGEAEIIDTDHKLMPLLRDDNYEARIERAMIIKVNAWDANCPQHITHRYTQQELELQLGSLKDQIRELEHELERHHQD